jgi:hypothetical protein
LLLLAVSLLLKGRRQNLHWLVALRHLHQTCTAQIIVSLTAAI